MLCPNCNNPIAENAKFCDSCGTAVTAAPVATATPEIPPITIVNNTPAASPIPEQYRPLSPWAYFGLTLLYAIPIVGFVFLIVFSFNSGNINRRNFTRSYWCALLLVLIIAAIIGLITLAGASIGAASYYY